MVNENNRYRTINEAFEELQQARRMYESENRQNNYNNINNIQSDVYYSDSVTPNMKDINQDKLSFKQWVKYRVNRFRYNKKEIRKVALITFGVFSICTMVVSTNYIFAQYNKEEEIKQKIATNVFETNKESLNIQKIIIENVEITKSKKIIEGEERELPYNVKRQNNDNLPKGEEVTVQEGQFGKKLVDCIKNYEDNTYIDETITDETVVLQPVTEIIDVGTSEFLASLKAHIGDSLYVTDTVNLKEKADDKSENLCIILDSLDVKLDELAGDWCKVTYENYTGYVKNDELTSTYKTPGIGEKNRKQKLYATLNPNMDLTKPSGLTLEDYKKVLSGNSADKNKIIEQNAENFYNAEKKYKVNGIFLASMAIHESAWGTSQIAKDKKNLFGFGAYDRSPYESANSFDEYSKGIETVAKYLAINYLNKSGTKISENETATGRYYNEPTIAGVNTKYCTDKGWSTKIYKYMDMLYSKL